MKRILLGTSLVLLAGVVAAPAAWADPPPWAPAHGYRAKHQYVYYPDSEVYYAPDTRTWFWLNGSNWQSGVSLPAGLQAFVRVGGVTISLDSGTPYVEHGYVVQQYGGHVRHYEDEDDDDQGHGHGHKHHKHHGDDGD